MILIIGHSHDARHIPGLLRDQGCAPATDVQPHSTDMQYTRPMQSVDAQLQQDMVEHPWYSAMLCF